MYGWVLHQSKIHAHLWYAHVYRFDITSKIVLILIFFRGYFLASRNFEMVAFPFMPQETELPTLSSGKMHDETDWAIIGYNLKLQSLYITKV
jgi:hypothetical protein